MYSIATLLSLQPLADQSMKGKIRDSCPEIVMSRKMRKGVGFNNGRRNEVVLVTPAPTFDAGVKDTMLTTTTVPPASTPVTLRVVPPRRSGRVPERRRNAFVPTFGTRRVGEDSWRLHAPVPMSPVLLA